LNDQNWAEEALSPIIFDETTLSLFGKNGTFMDWKMISARIKADYPTIGEKLVRISEGLFQDHIYRVLDATISKDTATTMTEDDWSKISGILNKRFKGYDYHHILLQEKANYYAAKKLWPDCTNSTYALIRQYGDKMGNLDLNNRCWEVIFLHSADPKILSEAAKQVKGSIDRNPNKDFSMSIDTYANLLYKLGKRNEALTWENRAIEISIKYNGDPRDLNDFKTNLAKMQQGKSTWEN
jgi:tetratricopeptide (TPR) repeat protein